MVDERGRTVVARDATRLFVPASNTKLVVSAAAAVLLDPDLRLATSVYPAGTLHDGVLTGTLVLYGRGDPTFSRRCYAVDTLAAGACDGDPEAPFRALARRLRAAGLRRVDGDLVGDGSFFEPELVRRDWEWYDLTWWYAAPVSGLGFNDNSVDVTVRPGARVGDPPLLSIAPDFGVLTLENAAVTDTAGAPATFDLLRAPGSLHVRATGRLPGDAGTTTEHLAFPDPARYAALALRRALADEGVVVTGEVRGTADSTLFAPARAGTPLAEVQGRPLRDWIFPVLNTSQNWYAEHLVKLLGRLHGGAGSWAAGLAVERRFLIDSVGIDSTLFRLSDGSGLSAVNFIAPAALTRLLRWMRAHPRWPVFAAGLPRSGRKGSLARRFTGTPLEGRVAAKTGSIGGVNTLSGFVEHADGRVWTFSLMLNHHGQPSRDALARLDSVVVELARPSSRR